MRKKIYIVWAAVAAMMMGCKSDIDLKNIDMHMQVDGGMALPVGSMTFKVGDFLGNGKVAHFYVMPYDQSSDSGVIYYKDTLSVEDRTFHQYDVESKLMQSGFVIIPTPPVLPAGTIITESCTIGLSLKDINTTADERIDSTRLITATVRTIISKYGAADLKWSDIQSASITLDDNIHMWDGQQTRSIDLTGHDFGDTIDVVLNGLSLNVMKDKSKPEFNNTLDSLFIRLDFTLQPQSDVTTATDDYLIFHQQLCMIDYEAVWGYFEGGKDVRAHGAKALTDWWSDWSKFEKGTLRLAKPSLTMMATHCIAAPLMLYMDSICTVNNKGERRYATWGGKQNPRLAIDDPLLPYTPLTDSAFQQMRFDEKESNGHLDNLFTIRPDSLCYGYSILIDKDISRYEHGDYPYKQHRLVKDVVFHTKAIIDLPFIFNAGAEVSYGFTQDSVHINEYSLDSLRNKQNWIDTLKTSNLRLILTAENCLPFRVAGHVVFEDEAGQDVGIRLTEDNVVIFPAPDNIVDERVVSGNSVTYSIVLDNETAKRLARVKKIQYLLVLDGNVKKTAVTDKSKLKIKIGVSAYVNGILNLNNVQKQ